MGGIGGGIEGDVGWQRGCSGGEIGADSRARFGRNQSEFLLFECKFQVAEVWGMYKTDGGSSGVDGLCLHHRIKYNKYMATPHTHKYLNNKTSDLIRSDLH